MINGCGARGPRRVPPSGEIRARAAVDLPATMAGSSGPVTGVRVFARVVRMPDNHVDPSGNTEAFRAFTQNAPQEPAAASRTPLIVGGAIVLVVLIAVIVWALA